MGIDLLAMSRGELETLKTEIDKALVLANDRDRREALKAAEKAAAEFGFTLSEIVQGRVGAKRGITSGVAKYRNPENPNQTWTGKGRQPKWFKAALAARPDPSDMEI